jgi:hypothetical protein
MAYTALSRVRRLSDIILLNLDITRLQMKNDRVIQEYARLASLPLPGSSANWGTVTMTLPINDTKETNGIDEMETEEDLEKS